MGRHKEFEDSEALQRAMFLFWERGYESASLKELLTTMEIPNGSFYHTFGSKKELFLQVLEHYNADFSQRRLAVFERGKGFKKSIRVIIGHVLDRQLSSECPKGCLLFNSVVSDALTDPDIKSILQRYIGDFENLLADEIKKAITMGELDHQVDPRKTAAVLVIYLQGVMGLSLMGAEVFALKSQTEYFLTALGV
jgi:TetR/AcrR family transcriptional repressor of nem operon